MPRLNWICRIPLLTVALCLAGCGGGGDEVPAGRVAVYPVEGSITWNGEPVADATITLHAEGLPGSFARSDAGGEFSFNTYAEGDGAPAGSYTVTVSKMVDVNAGNSGDAIDANRGPAQFESQVPEHLSKKETSGLTVTIQAETTNVLTITLADDEGASQIQNAAE